MTELEPNIVQMEGLDQNGDRPGAVCPQNVRKDLVARQSGLPRRGVKLRKTAADPPAGRFLEWVTQAMLWALQKPAALAFLLLETTHSRIPARFIPSSQVKSSGAGCQAV